MTATGHWDLVVVGAGHAGSELAVAARQAGWAGSILLVGEESRLPYHRPPLSKAYLAGEADDESIALRPEAAYSKSGVTRLAGVRVLAIDRAAKALDLDSGARLHYGRLALCTGGRPRPLACAGIDLASPPTNLLYLRTADDALRMRPLLAPGRRLVVIGGGYVGLEVAASATKLGASVTVLESMPRVLARVAGEPLSAFYADVHRGHGVNLVTGAVIERIDCSGSVIDTVHSNGTRHPADLVVAGIGMLPCTELAQACGLAGPEGIPVDGNGQTSDPDIFAAGDCTLHVHPAYGRQLRIESVPNALEQARAAAAFLCGKAKPYNAIPWFWSDQYDLKLQMAGLSQGHDSCVLRGDVAARSFSALYTRAGRLIAIDAVNRPAEFMLVRRVLARMPEVDPQQLADESIPLKTLLAEPGAAPSA